MKWDEITKTEKYRNQTPEQQELTRNLYFEEVVKPELDESGWVRARQLFDAETMPTATEKLPSEADKLPSFKEELRALGEGINRFESGIFQRGIQLGEYLGLADEGAYEDYTKSEKARRAEFEQLPVAKTTAGKLLVPAGEMAIPALATPAAHFGTWANILYGGAVGGTAAALTFHEPGEEVLNSVMKGIIFGGGFQGVFEFGAKAPTFWARHVLKNATKQSEYKEGVNLVKQMREAGIKEFDLGIEELTGLPSVISARRTMMLDVDIADDIWKHQQQSAKSFTKYYVKNLHKYFPNKTNPTDLVNKLDDGYSAFVSKAVKARSDQWKQDMNVVNTRLAGKKAITLNRTYDVIQEEIEKLTGKLAAKDPNTLKLLQDLEEQIRPRNAMGRFTGQNKVTALELQEALSSWGEMAANSPSMVKSIEEAKKLRVSKRIFKSLQEDLDMATNNPSLGEAALALQTARNNFKVNSDSIKLVTRSTIGKLFDKGIDEIRPEDIANKVSKWTPSEMSLATKTFDTIDTSIMDDVRSHILRDAFRSSLESTKIPGLNKINFEKLSNNLPSTGTLRELLAAQGGRQEFHLAVKAANRMATRMEQISTGQISEKAQDALGNLASQSGIFISRMLAKIFMPKSLAKLATSEGREALMTMQKTRSNADFIAAATILLGDDVNLEE